MKINLSEVSGPIDGSSVDEREDLALPTEPGLYWVTTWSSVTHSRSAPQLVVVEGKSPYLSMTRIYPPPSIVLNPYLVDAVEAIESPELT